MHSRFPIWVRSGLLLAVLAGSQTGCKAWKMPGSDMFPWSKKPSQDKLLGTKPPTNLPSSNATTLVQDSSSSSGATSGGATSSGPVSPAARNTPSPIPNQSMATRPPAAQCPVARCPVARCPVARCPVARCPVARCPATRWQAVPTACLVLVQRRATTALLLGILILHRTVRRLECQRRPYRSRTPMHRTLTVQPLLPVASTLRVRLR